MTKVSELMSTDVLTVGPETKISEVAKLLLEKKINGLPVVDKDNKLIGIICQSDIVYQQKKAPIPSVFTLLDGFIPLTSTSHIEKELRKISAISVEQAMSLNPVSVHPDTDLEDLAEIMIKKKYHTIPVVDKGKLVGVIGKEDVLKTLIR